MSASKVFFTDFRCRLGVSQLDKLRKLLEKSEFSKIDFDGKFVAIKLHFGEPGNLSFLRPNYAKAVADVVKELGGIPFLTDCNTLYVGRRKHALEHLEAAQENGFSPLSTGCQIIIADGLKGTDEVEVPVEGGEYVTAAKIGRAVMDADVFISLAHFKGHDSTGFGGAIKNKPFTTENARRLGESIRKIKEQTGGSILITTSRRTGAEAENIIKKEIEGIPAYTYWWGEKKDNPIMGFWALADNIIATGDSVSMPCECCGSGKPVLLFTGEGWLTPKHERFVKSLIDGGYAVHIDAPDALSFRPQKTLNPAGIIAEKIDAL